jgi:hypothetical protein
MALTPSPCRDERNNRCLQPHRRKYVAEKHSVIAHAFWTQYVLASRVAAVKFRATHRQRCTTQQAGFENIGAGRAFAVGSLQPDL